MASNVIRATLLSDAKRFKAGMKEAEQSTQGLEGKVKSSAGVIKGVLAGTAALAVKDFVGDSIRAYSDLEQSTGAMESVFGRFAGGIEKSAKGAADAVGLSTSEYQQLAAVLGAQLQNMGFSIDEAAEKSQELIAVGADLSATYGGTAAEAIQSISSLLRGERDPIEKYAVSIKDADVQARNLAKGLDTSTSEAKKNSDAISALDLLLEQAAPSAGSFAREVDTIAGKAQRAAAELENAKAQLGQGFQQAVQGATPVIGAFADGVGYIGIAMQQATGQITAAEASLKLWENRNDRAVESAEDAIDVHEREHTAYEDLIPLIDLNRYELERLAAMDHEAADAVRARLAVLDQEAKDLQRGKGREEEYAKALKGTEDQTRQTTASIKDYSTELRALSDPVFAAMRAARDLEDAQKAVNDAVKEHGEGSAEHLAALQDEAEATLDAAGAYGELAESGIASTRAEAIKLFESLGLDRKEAELLADELASLDAIKLGDKTVSLKVSVPTIEYVEGAGNKLRPIETGRRVLAHGGVGLARIGGTDARIAEAGADEAVIPLNSQGIGKIAEAMRQAGLTGGGPTVQIVINAGFGTDVRAVQRAVVEALQSWERSNGAIPITVRSVVSS